VLGHTKPDEQQLEIFRLRDINADLLAALEQVRASLANWLEIQSPEDAREYDAQAMAAADSAIAKARGG